jgi:predicted kinase
LSLKSLITEAVVVDSMFDIEQELLTIKESILEQMMTEGVDDPGILKCVFMAGGPGSGKSFTAMEIFGIDKRTKQSFSATGLKSVNSDSAFESLLKKNGIDPRDLARIEKEEPELWDMITTSGKVSGTPLKRVKYSKSLSKVDPAVGDSIRTQAKKLTQKQKAFYEAGRLGMIIDGTGHEYTKIDKLKKHAESLGYDTYMVFVNTSLEVAKERNLQRDRVLPDELLTKSWQDVQNNLGKFQNLFGGNFRIVDNTVYKPIGKDVQKAINQFIRKPIYNRIGKKWIETARALKNANLIKK